jgi:serine/threonine-protein kinase
MNAQPGWRSGLLRLKRRLMHVRKRDRAYASSRQGWNYLLQGQYARALSLFNEALATAPAYAHALTGRGRTYYGMRQYERAKADFAHALRLKTRNFEAQFWLGQTLYTLAEYHEAINAYSRALWSNARAWAAYANRAQTYVCIQEYHKALADFSSALQLSPASALTYTNRGLTYLALKQYKEALADLNHALERDPQQRRAYFGKGQAHYGLKDYQQALACYRQALDLAPTCQTYNNLGITLDALGEHTRAIDAYTRAIACDPVHWVPYNNRGWSYLALQENASALADVERAIAICPTEAYAAYLNRAWIFAGRRQYGRALEECDHILVWGIHDALAYAYRAGIRYWQGEDEQALADCICSLEKDPSCIEAYGVRGLVYRRQGRSEDAQTALAHARTLGHNLFWLEEETTARRKERTKGFPAASRTRASE